jgi:hypothetical protein
LHAAYPRQPFGTIFGFRRIFAVAHKLGQGADLRDVPGPGRGRPAAG